jgi:hypothetical protein
MGVENTIDDDDPVAEFAPFIGTGMSFVPDGAGAEFNDETRKRLQERLNEFDAVRTRGEAESRSTYPGGRTSR